MKWKERKTLRSVMYWKDRAYVFRESYPIVSALLCAWLYPQFWEAGNVLELQIVYAQADSQSTAGTQA